MLNKHLFLQLSNKSINPLSVFKFTVDRPFLHNLLIFGPWYVKVDIFPLMQHYISYFNRPRNIQMTVDAF